MGQNFRPATGPACSAASGPDLVAHGGGQALVLPSKNGDQANLHALDKCGVYETQNVPSAGPR